MADVFDTFLGQETHMHSRTETVQYTHNNNSLVH